MSASTAKVYIQIESEAEQQEHLKHQRKTLKPIQANANDKENLTGRASIVDQLSRLKAGVSGTPKYGKRKCSETGPSALTTTLQDAETQTEEVQKKDAITADDLTSACEPGEHYYKLLAEQRRSVLEETLVENRHLHERIDGLEEEMGTLRKELDEAKYLVDVLKEIVDDDEKSEAEEEEEQTAANEDDDAAPVDQ